MPLDNVDDRFVSSLSRYGHTAVPYNESFLVFGGFTGQMKNDVLKFTLGQLPIDYNPFVYSPKISRP